MESVISKKLYNTIKELTIKGDLNSFEFYFQNKGVDVFINGIYNKKLNKIFNEYDELYGQLECFSYDNEFMFNGTFYPYIEEGTLKIKVTFTDDVNDYDGISWTIADLQDEVEDKIDKKLCPKFDFDNLNLQMSIESSRELGIQLDSYNLIYSVPESEELIDLSEDRDLKKAIFGHFQLWAAENSLGTRTILGEELDFNFSFLIEESYLSSYIEYIHDTITLNITE